MRRFLANNVIESLSDADVQSLLNEHLRYRLQMICDARDRMPAKTFADNQAFEAGAVAGRSLLAFLGVAFDRKKGVLVPYRSHIRLKGGLTDEVKVTDVGGRYVEIDRLTARDAAILARFIEGVHKACAHFTWKSEHRLDRPTFTEAANLILRLYAEHIETEKDQR